MWTSRGPCSRPQRENSGGPGEVHAGFGQEKGITGKRLQETGEKRPPDLARAAVEAVSQWRYQPTLLNGEPVEVDTVVTVNFKLLP